MAAPATENRILFEMKLEAEAEVIRGCCGMSHDFGAPCPTDSIADAVGDDDDDDDDNIVRGEELR